MEPPGDNAPRPGNRALRPQTDGGLPEGQGTLGWLSSTSVSSLDLVLLTLHNKEIHSQILGPSSHQEGIRQVDF